MTKNCDNLYNQKNIKQILAFYKKLRQENRKNKRKIK